MKSNALFQQRAKIGVAGNFINQFMGNNSTLPEVGKGMTQMHYSDRTCYEVIEVSADFKTVLVEHLDATHDNSCPAVAGHQDWILSPTGYFQTVVWRKNGWCFKGEEVVFTKEFARLADEAGHYFAQAHLTPTQKEFIYAGNVWPQNVIEGITKRRNTYHKINVIFGVKDYRYDWEF